MVKAPEVEFSQRYLEGLYYYGTELVTVFIVFFFTASLFLLHRW